MKHQRDKDAILNATMGYATHKNTSVDEYFKNSDKLKHNKEILKLNKRQAKLVEEDSLSKDWNTKKIN